MRYNKLLPIVFMHIPKTSGVAIRHMLVVALAPSLTVDGLDHSLFDSSAYFDSMDESLRRQIYSSPSSLPEHANLVAGHFALSTLLTAYPLAQRLTILREPFSRLLSHWLYWRQYADTDLAAWGDWAAQVRMSRQPLVDFLSASSLACQTDNLMLRMLLWPHPLITADHFINPVHDHRLLRDAMMRLRNFDFVDVLEDGALVDNLQRWLGTLSGTINSIQRCRSPRHSGRLCNTS
jgi:hypothetical protein